MADKALLLGINVYKSVNGLRGCLNDVENMRRLLTEQFGFRDENVKALHDSSVVKSEVKKQLKWLFKDAKPGDRVVLHYSGHGSQTADLDGDEDDGADELLCLYDMDFNDPDTYLLDDELRRWTETLPKGVHLTVVLDSCHSGTGTRLLMAPAPGKPHQSVPMRVDARATSARALHDSTARGIDAAETVAAALDPEGDNIVRIRYVDPPPGIKAAIASRKKKTNRGLVIAPLNHILLSGCRSDQTSADATIGGSPNGAFTYYLCKTIREGGAGLERKALIERVVLALRQGQFSQVPQLETSDAGGSLFGGAHDEPATGSSSPPAGPEPTGPGPARSELKPGYPCDWETFCRGLALLPLETQREALRLFADRAASSRDVTGQRQLVYVHGICKHDAGYSTPWWNALHPFTTAFGAGTLGGTREEVLWSDLVNARGLELRASRAVDSRAAREADEAQRAGDEIREALRDRVDRQTVETGAAAAAGEAPRELTAEARGLSIPGLNCIDDFTVYMVNDSVRAQVIERFTRVVRPLLQAGTEIDIISHSWGTVVAYEGLRELADGGLTTPRVRNFFTAGAALSLGPVKMRLRPANRDGQRPAMVRRWVNLNARGDVVGGPLQGRPYAVDDDFPNLAPFGCSSVLGLVNPVCAHGSYFVAGNEAVNRNVFARFIDQA